MVRPDDIAIALSLIYGSGADLKGRIPVVEVYDVKQGNDRKSIRFFSAVPAAIAVARDRADALAREDRSHSRPAHVALIPVTLGSRPSKNGRELSAKTDNVSQIYALRIDHDQQPLVSCAKLREAGLEPTFSTQSGGVVSGVAKRHDYYCLETPVGGADVNRAKEINKRLIAFCGSGDPNAASPVQPMRCPGGLHRKGAPCPSTLLSRDSPAIRCNNSKRPCSALLPSECFGAHCRRSYYYPRDGRDAMSAKTSLGSNTLQGRFELLQRIARTISAAESRGAGGAFAMQPSRTAHRLHGTSGIGVTAATEGYQTLVDLLSTINVSAAYRGLRAVIVVPLGHAAYYAPGLGRECWFEPRLAELRATHIGVVGRDRWVAHRSWDTLSVLAESSHPSWTAEGKKWWGIKGT